MKVEAMTCRAIRKALIAVEHEISVKQRRYERLSQRARVLNDLIDMGVHDINDIPERQAPKTIRNSLAAILQSHGSKMHARDLLAVLDQQGVIVPGNDRLNNVRAHLSNDDRFRSVGSGCWELVRSSWRQPATVTS